ncbi:MAG: dicarboxylate/amino acid:cation symporter, partial [Alphaproteobacteria bacterium]
MGFTRSLIDLQGHLAALVRNRLWLQVLIGMALGVGAGVLLGPDADLIDRKTAELFSSWIALPGNLFLVAIQFVVVPLVVASVMRGIAAGEAPEKLGRLGLWAVGFFVMTTILAVVVGLGVAEWIAPGAYIDRQAIQAGLSTAPVAAEAAQLPAASEIPQLIVHLFPSDPLSTLVSGNMLQIVIAAVILGVALVAIPEKERKPLLDLLASVQAVCMVIVGWVLRFAPIAVFALLAKISSRIGINALIGMGVYVGTVLLGLLLLFLFYLGVAAIVGKRSPGKFLRAARENLLLAFSTSSSAAVMPVTMRTAEEGLGVRSSITRFTIARYASASIRSRAAQLAPPVGSSAAITSSRPQPG